MSEKGRIYLLILIMAVVALLVGGISLSLLYQTALKEEQDRLIVTAQTQARLMESMAQFDSLYSQAYPDGAAAATLKQIIDAHNEYIGFGETGEFTLAKLQGDQIVFLLNHRLDGLDHPEPIPLQTQLAEPMRRALAGLSGTVVGLDYRGETVLAAYEPVAFLDLGIVVKIDLAEIRAPFIRAAAIAGAVGIAVVVIGAVLFMRINESILTSIQQSTERFRTAFEYSASGMCLTSLDGKLLKVNQAMSQMFGLSKEALEGIHFNEITWSEDLEVGKNVMRQMLAGEVPSVSFEKRYQRQNGEPFWTHVTSALLRDTAGQPLHFITQIGDITEKTRAFQAIVESERRYRALFENMNTGFVLFEVVQDKQGVPIDLIILGANQGFEKTTGLHIQEVIGKNLTEVLPGIENDAASWIKTYGEVALTGESCHFEQGSELLGYYYSINAYQAEPNQCAVTFLDITEQKKTLAEIEQRNKRLQILREIDISILQADSFEKIIQVALHSIRDLIDCQRANLTLIDWDANESLIYHVSMLDETQIPVGTRFPLADYEEIIQVLQQNQTLVMNDLLSLIDPKPAVQKLILDGIQSICSFPIFSRGDLIGMVSLSSQIPEFFDDEVINLGQELVNQLTIAYTQQEIIKALQLSEERLRLSTELANVAVWEFNFSTNTMGRSKNHDSLYGLDWQTTWKFETFLQSTHPDDREYSNSIIQKSAAPGGPDNYAFDFRVVYPDGSIHWLYVVGQVLERDEQGKGRIVRGSLIDITKRKKIEEDLRESEEKFSTIVQSSPIPITIYSMDGQIIETNPAYLELTGYSYDETIGSSSTNQGLLSPETRQRVIKEMEENGNSLRNLEIDIRVRDGTTRTILLSGEDIIIQGVRHRLGINVDITERKHALDALKQSNKQLRYLTSKITQVEESERLNIARELHDSVGQNLTVLSININMLRNLTSQEHLDKLLPFLDESQKTIEDISIQIRNVMAELRPPELDDFGLAAALRSFAASFSTRNQIQIDVTKEDLEPILPTNVAIVLFRIAQETLTNISKHAQANRAGITLTQSAGRCRMIISDDGIGFDLLALKTESGRKSWGLLNIRERAEAIGGDIQIETQPGQGTRVMVDVPL